MKGLAQLVLIVSVVVAGLVLIAPGGGSAAPNDAPAIDLSQVDAGDRWLRAKVAQPGGEIFVETSYDQGVHWYGAGFGGANAVAGTIRITIVGSSFLLTVANTSGEVWYFWRPIVLSGEGTILPGWTKAIK